MHLTFGDFVTTGLVVLFLVYGYYRFIRTPKTEVVIYTPSSKVEEKETDKDTESIMKKWYPDHVVSPDEVSSMTPKTEIRVEDVKPSTINKESKDFNVPAEDYIGQKSSRASLEEDNRYSDDNPAGIPITEKVIEDTGISAGTDILFDSLGEEINPLLKEIKAVDFNLRFDLKLKDDEFDAEYDKGVIVDVVSARFEDKVGITTDKTKVVSVRELERSKKVYKNKSLLDQDYSDSKEDQLLKLVVKEILEFYGRKGVSVLSVHQLKTPLYLPSYL